MDTTNSPSKHCCRQPLFRPFDRFAAVTPTSCRFSHVAHVSPPDIHLFDPSDYLYPRRLELIPNPLISRINHSHKSCHITLLWLLLNSSSSFTITWIMHHPTMRTSSLAARLQLILGTRTLHISWPSQTTGYNASKRPMIEVRKMALVGDILDAPTYWL